MPTQKVGCFLINKKSKEILIYRQKQQDYSFPKGHVEDGESIRLTAIREVEEETKRSLIIINEYEPIKEEYTTSKGEKYECYMFFAIDNGISDNKSEDTHDVIWTPFDKVEETLSYDNLKSTWNSVKKIILEILEK